MNAVTLTACELFGIISSASVCALSWVSSWWGSVHVYLQPFACKSQLSCIWFLRHFVNSNKRSAIGLCYPLSSCVLCYIMTML